MPTNSLYSLIFKKEDAHDDPIYTCAWGKYDSSIDSKEHLKNFIVTGGLDCSVKVWEVQNNKLQLRHTLRGHSMAVVSVAISPDAYTIASTSLDSTLIVWDLIAGQQVLEISTEATHVWKVIYSPDGAKVATGGHLGNVIIYDLETGNVVKMLNTRGKFVLSVAWSPNSKYIASGSVDGTVCIFDIAQAILIHTIEAHRESVRSVAFSPNSKLLVTASNDGKVKIYDVGNGCLQDTLEHKCWVLSACFSPDGTRVATAAADGTVQVALLDGLTVINCFKEHTDKVWTVQFNLSGKKLVSVSKDKSINIYECPIPPKNVPKKEYTLTK